MHSRTQTSVPAGWRAALGLVGLAVVLATLHRLDHPLLAPPDVTTPSGWAAWAETAGPVAMLMSSVRLAAIGLSWYLLVAAVLQVLAAATGARIIAAAADALATARTRDVLVAVVGTGLLASASLETTTTVAASLDVGPATPSSMADDDAGPHLHRLDPLVGDVPHLSRLVRAPRRADTTTAPHLARLPAGGHPPTTTSPMPTPGADDLAEGPTMHPQVVDDAPNLARLDAVGADDPDRDDRAVDGRGERARRWTVRPGDHFWHVAEHHVAAGEGTPSEARVRAYWRRLVDVNRDRLVDPANPDLLLPGQVLLLPPEHPS